MLKVQMRWFGLTMKGESGGIPLATLSYAMIRTVGAVSDRPSFVTGSTDFETLDEERAVGDRPYRQIRN
jgi:hypothetical protein